MTFRYALLALLPLLYCSPCYAGPYSWKVPKGELVRLHHQAIDVDTGTSRAKALLLSESNVNGIAGFIKNGSTSHRFLINTLLSFPKVTKWSKGKSGEKLCKTIMIDTLYGPNKIKVKGNIECSWDGKKIQVKGIVTFAAKKRLEWTSVFNPKVGILQKSEYELYEKDTRKESGTLSFVFKGTHRLHKKVKSRFDKLLKRDSSDSIQ